MNFMECKVAIDFTRHHLSHMDPVIFRDDNLPLELFLDYDNMIRPFAREIRSLKDENELREEKYWKGLLAMTHYFSK
jgi:hypothetical protein